jgi:hypothetical protein
MEMVVGDKCARLRISRTALYTVGKHIIMAVPKFKHENLLYFIAVALIWLLIVYIVLQAMLDVAEQFHLYSENTTWWYFNSRISFRYL